MPRASSFASPPARCFEVDTVEIPGSAFTERVQLDDPLVHTLARDLVAMNHRLEDVAAILGACDRCFGIDRTCARCSGAGSPGWCESNEPALLEYWLRNLESPRYRRPRAR